MADLVERVPLQQVRDLLQVGMALPFRVLDSSARLLLSEGHILASESQFESLVERGAWAERPLVDSARALLAELCRQPKAAAPSLFDLWEKLLWEFDKLTRGLVRKRMSGSLVRTFSDSLLRLVEEDPDVALFFCSLQEDRRFALYPLTHALHCAVISYLTAKQLAWSADRLACVTCSALTMNLTILELQAVMAEQDDPPTAKQLKEIRTHPTLCVELLRASGIEDEEWLIAVAQHHEHPGGGGYPTGMTEVSDVAQVLRAGDVYMAKISPRAKRPPMPAHMAIKQLFQQRPGDALAMATIKTLGVHPPGSLVKLQSGEVAVVIRRSPTGTHPVVATLSDEKGLPSVKTLVRDSQEPAFRIVGPMGDSRLFARILPERVYGLLPARGHH